MPPKSNNNRLVKSMTLNTAKDVFCGMFPALKIEFYKKAHSEHEGSPSDDLWEDDLHLSDIMKVQGDIKISLSPLKTVAQLEAEFEKYGLHVQVFRWSKNLWLQTTTTDDLTLAQQNERGMESTTLNKAG